MHAPDLKPHGHSADVRIVLSVNGHLLPVTKIGADFLVVKEPIDHPPADAEIAMSVDGKERRWLVHLPAGLSAAERRTPITRR
jgi:hypothetical protein